jgi:hypothetical protein
MNSARKLLIFGGLALAVFGMLYGLHYALFVEHQTLDRMGGSLAEAFVQAAGGNGDGAVGALDSYTNTKYVYVRQVDVHSHWIGMAMIMIVLGVVFDSVGFAESVRFWIALALLVGSVIFPLGVLLQTLQNGGAVPSALAIAGAALVTVALGAVAVGFARQSS